MIEQTLHQGSGAISKKNYFAKLCVNFVSFSSFFWLSDRRNVEKAYFDQHLECAAPKCWSKYTTAIHISARPIATQQGCAKY